MEPVRFSLLVGWTSMVAGVLSGAAVGLFFHDEQWLGGYASLRRRMLRLGHIAFFGIGILNVLFALSIGVLPLSGGFARIGSIGFAVGAMTMPVCCFLTAWRKPFRHLFPLPVAAVLTGIVSVLAGWWSR